MIFKILFMMENVAKYCWPINFSVLCTESGLISDLFFSASMEESFKYSRILLHVENH